MYRKVPRRSVFVVVTPSRRLCLALLCLLTDADSINLADLVIVFLSYSRTFCWPRPLDYLNSFKMMEVDTHSPSTRMTRSFSYSLKRPRSPGSPSQERQPVGNTNCSRDRPAYKWFAIRTETFITCFTGYVSESTSILHRFFCQSKLEQSSSTKPR